MKSTISTLTEKITLLKDSTDTGNTTVSRFEEVVKNRASIRPINSKLFEVVMLKPPAKFKEVQFSAIRRNNADYIYNSPFSEYKEKFVKGKIRSIKN